MVKNLPVMLETRAWVFQPCGKSEYSYELAPLKSGETDEGVFMFA